MLEFNMQLTRQQHNTLCAFLHCLVLLKVTKYKGMRAETSMGLLEKAVFSTFYFKAAE